MANITLSIDDETIKQARLRAVQEGTSLSAKMRELLQRYALGQADGVGPDYSFAENALMFARQQREAGAASAPDAQAAPVPSIGVGVDPTYLRQIRGWAREDLYEPPALHGASPPDTP